MAPFLYHRQEDLTYLGELAEKLKHQLRKLPVTTPQWGICHGDLHKQNFLIDEQKRLTIMDWDCVGYGWRAYDVAVLRWSIGPAVGPEGIGHPKTSEVYDAYLQGYHSLRSLGDVELQAIPYFVAVRAIWVVGEEIRQAIEHAWGTGWINDRYFDNFIKTLKGWMSEHCPDV